MPTRTSDLEIVNLATAKGYQPYQQHSSARYELELLPSWNTQALRGVLTELGAEVEQVQVSGLPYPAIKVKTRQVIWDGTGFSGEGLGANKSMISTVRFLLNDEGDEENE